MTRILLVDDDKDIRQLLTLYLQNEGYNIIEAENGEEAIEMMNKHHPDIVLLDVMMPKKDGFTIVQEIRQSGNAVPVLMLTARQEDMDLIQGLTYGADDYIKKPFNPLEVIARVKAMLRRVNQFQLSQSSEARLIGPFELREDERLILKENEPLALTKREFDLLSLLLTQAKRVFTAEELYEKIWQEDALGSSSNAVMVLIHKLREKVEETPKSPRYIQTVWGVGYKLEP
ncbi:response regulator transcription factor [Bacillus sp. CGMCC 1.16541]|uniref:response regulator transcription factor n=1 Tax=Bacillus sp. CGMCC 1.16541 TaxID=2185143 RepID=UPI000D73D33D|nr:response regulator transcription factor [Bacillus sp. CGMCC 1.16541]